MEAQSSDDDDDDEPPELEDDFNVKITKPYEPTK